MATMHSDAPGRSRHASKPAVGRPVLFALMLVAAALGMLALLVAGPGLALPVAIAAAAGLMGLVAIAWAVAGPRL